MISRVVTLIALLCAHSTLAATNPATIGDTNARLLIAAAEPAPSKPAASKRIPTTPTAGARKFHPGFGVRANSVVYPANAEDRRAAYMQVCEDPNISLILISVPWGIIEPQRGVYDFTQIDTDLAIAKQCGKRLIIEPWYQKYNAKDGSDTRHFPAYINAADGVGLLKGGDGVAYEAHVKINEAQWTERFYQLFAAIASRYDENPDVEQIVITETASTSSPGSDSRYILTLAPRVQSLFKRTTVVVYPNWMDTPEQARDLLKIIADNGMGVGAPDIIGPPGMSDQDMGSRALQGIGKDRFYSKESDPIGDFGSTDYRGQIVISYQFQGMREVPAAKVIDYALDKLKATHLIFSMINGYGGESQWRYTRDAIAANAGRLNKKRPTALR